MDSIKQTRRVEGLENEEIGPGRNDPPSTHVPEDEYQRSKLIRPDSTHDGVDSLSFGIRTLEITARQNDSTEDQKQMSGIGKSALRPGNNGKSPAASREFNFNGYPKRSTTPVWAGKGKLVQASNNNATNPQMALEVMGDYYKTGPTAENKSKGAPFYNRYSNNGAHHGPSDESIYMQRNDSYGERERSILQEIDTNEYRRLLDDAMWLASEACANDMAGAGNTTIRESKSSRSFHEKSSYSSMAKPNCRRPWVNRAYGSGNRAYNKNGLNIPHGVDQSGDDRRVINDSVWPTAHVPATNSGEAPDSTVDQPSSTPGGSHMKSRSDAMTRPNYRRPWLNRAYSGSNRAYNKSGLHIHHGVEQSGDDSVEAPDPTVDQSLSTGSSQMKSPVNFRGPWLDAGVDRAYNLDYFPSKGYEIQEGVAQNQEQLDDSGWPTAMTHIGDTVEVPDATAQQLLSSESHQKMNTSGDMMRRTSEMHNKNRGVIAGLGGAFDTATDELLTSAFPRKEMTLGEMMRRVCELNERRRPSVFGNPENSSGKSQTRSQTSSVSDAAEVNLSGIRTKYRDYRETVGPHNVERARANIAFGHIEHKRIKERMAKRRSIRKPPSFDNLEVDTPLPNWIDVGDPEVHTAQPNWTKVEVNRVPNPDIFSDEEDLDYEP